MTYSAATNSPTFDDYVQGTLDSIVTEAHATKGSLRLGVAVAILIIDRRERFILTEAEALRAFELADTDVCGLAKLTRMCRYGHEWVHVTTTAGETFDLPFVTPAHGSA